MRQLRGGMFGSFRLRCPRGVTAEADVRDAGVPAVGIRALGYGEEGRGGEDAVGGGGCEGFMTL